MRPARCSLLLAPACAALIAACADAPARDASADAPAADTARDAPARDTLAADTPAADAPVADAPAPDAPAPDAPAPDTPADAGPGLDAPAADAPAADAPAADAPRDAGAADAPLDVPTGPTHVHIGIDNFCRVTVTPMSVTVPVMSRAMFAFHNHSVDYHADVWMSYGGGFLDLGLGATWNDPIGHCNTPTVHDEYADINIAGGPTSACPGVRFMIHCR